MATINPHTTRATGTVLTAAIYNADHQNHVTNANSLNAELITDTADIANHEGRITAIEGSPPGFSLPVGSVLDYGGVAAPAGWLLCFGQAISRATYVALFTAIGTAYGAGDGTTTFNVPDYRGRVSAGQDDMGGTSANRLTTAGGLDGDVLGGAGGAETVALTTANLAAHTHTGPSHTHTGTTGNANVGHAHSINSATSASGTSTEAAVEGVDNGGSATTSTSGNLHTHTFTTAAGGTGATGSAGSGTAHANVQPTLIANKIIYTSV